MGRFDRFNKVLDKDILAGIDKVKDEAGTGEFREVPKGEYKVEVVKFEVGECGEKAKLPGAPLLKADFRIVEGPYAKSHIFVNKMLYTDRTDDQWNMVKLMGGVLGWIKTLEPSEDIKVEFTDYDQFEDMVLDIAEDISGLQYKVDYDKDAFNPVHIKEVYE